MKIKADQRRSLILKLASERGAVNIVDLAELCGVSEMTVRRDLDLLADEEAVVRTHGGAVSLVSAEKLDLIEPSLDTRAAQHRDAKQHIARAARQMVEPGQSIALDIGTTTFELSQLLKDLPVRLFTNSLNIARNLAETSVDVYVPCGSVHGSEPSIVGNRTTEYFDNYRFDIAFIGASGISSEGVYDYSPEDTEVKRAMIARAHKVVMLIDSSKFERTSVARVATLNEFQSLVVDRDPVGLLADALQSSDIEIVVTR